MTDTARDLFLKGAKAAEQQKWDQCRAALLAALAIKPHPQIAGNLAGCELKLKLYRDAAEHLTYSLREMKPDSPHEWRANSETALREARAKVEAVRLSVNVAGAEVRVDGRVVGRAPLVDPLFVDPGSHTIEAVQEGFPAARATVEATAGGERAVALELRKSEPPPPPLPPPHHERRSVVPGAVLGGVAGVALVTGIGLYAGGRSKVSTAQMQHDAIVHAGNNCVSGATNYDPTCSALYSTGSTGNTLQRAGVGVLIGAGAAAVGTAIYFLLPTSSPGAPKSTRPRVEPALSATTAGFVFSGVL
jgi:hypothetical protein